MLTLDGYFTDLAKKTIEYGDFTGHLVGSKDSKIWTQHGEYSVHISARNLIGYYSQL